MWPLVVGRADRMRWLTFLLLAAATDDETDSLVYGLPEHALVMGMGPGYRSSSVQLGAFLDELRADGASLDVLPHRAPTKRREGRRTRVRIDLGDDLMQAARAEGARWRRARCAFCDLVTGDGVDRKAERARLAERARRRAEARTAEVEAAVGVPVETARLLDLLNAAPARFYASRVDRADHPSDALCRRPQPFYAASMRSQRIALLGTQLGNCPTAIRRTVLSDCHEVDMRSAQLALAAAIWGAQDAAQWLRDSPGDRWQDLDTWIRKEPSAEALDSDVRRALKQWVYSLCFGMTRTNLERWGSPKREGDEAARQARVAAVSERYGDAAAAARRLLRHPAIRSLYDARQRRLGSIRKTGRVVDVMGGTWVVGSDRGGAPVTARTALAAEIQAAEMFVMLRLADLFHEAHARKRPDIRLALWQSDGLSYHLRRKGSAGEAEKWFSRLDAALSRGCGDLRAATGCGPVHTSLVLKYQPPIVD